MIGFAKKQIARAALKWAGSALWEGDSEDAVILLAPDGDILLASQSTQALTGRLDLSDGTLSDLIVPQDRARVLGALAGALSGRENARAECRILTACGEVRWVELTASAAPSGQARLVLRDMSERRARDVAQNFARKNAESAATTQAAHLADLSHEIRTPLNAVIGFADMMRTETFGPLGHAKYEEYAGLIHKSGEHLLSLVSDLLDLSKIEAGKYQIAPEPVSLPQLASDCAEMMRLSAEEAGLSLKTQIEDDGNKVLADARLVRQVLLNLLSNAIKFTEQGTITLRLKQDAGNFWLSVIDTGIGMSAEDLARVGERFEQARREGVRGAKGTGLGLAVSAALAKLHGGELRLDSKEGAGTKAVLQLPYKSAAEQAADENAVADPAFETLGAELDTALKQA